MMEVGLWHFRAGEVVVGRLGSTSPSTRKFLPISRDCGGIKHFLPIGRDCVCDTRLSLFMLARDSSLDSGKNKAFLMYLVRHFLALIE